MVVEYIFSYGNFNVVLCERGICSFDSYICNVLDLGVVVVLKQLIYLLVIVDFFYVVGRRELVVFLVKVVVVCGVDGLMIECYFILEKLVLDVQ